MTHPNGVWIWRLNEIRRDYLERLVECQVKRVYLKVFDAHSSPMFWAFQCSEDIIREFNNYGIEVVGWGYHYGTPNVGEQVSAVRSAMQCGLTGYVADLESSVESAATHSNVEDLLEQLRFILSGDQFLGYTSFGHPEFHPNVPWRILDQYCDVAMPQIYFEKFTFGSSSEDEIQSCLKAHQNMNLHKPILPIWGSESDAANPASAGELQSCLNRFPGSSIWRIPREGEEGYAWHLNYGGSATVPVGGENMPPLPELRRILRRSVQGDDVESLQKVLNALGFNAGGVDGIFGSLTERAVRAFQTQAGISVDGVVGPETWGELQGQFNIEQPEHGNLARLADIAQQEGQKELSWTGSDCEAEKYLLPLRESMRQLGQIGSSPVFFNWCAAFVTWCCRKAGIQIPDVPQGFWATMALVESWKYWAKQQGYWHPADNFIPKRGDILVFEWFDGDVQLDHIGIVRSCTQGSDIIQTSEGNKGNRTQNAVRSMSNVPGFIRIT